jgi:hypothetical protein
MSDAHPPASGVDSGLSGIHRKNLKDDAGNRGRHSENGSQEMAATHRMRELLIMSPVDAGTGIWPIHAFSEASVPVKLRGSLSTVPEEMPRCETF